MDNKTTIKVILREQADNTIQRIAIFDFDGTLVNSPLPDEGKVEYEKKTGKPWPHTGWWSKPESLDSTIFNMSVIPETKSFYEREKSMPNTLMVMMTGRIQKLSGQVEAILNANGLKFDRYIYNRGGATLDSKINSLDMLLSEFPEVKNLVMFDDRIEHINPFKAWASTVDNLDFDITLIG
jgi:hypothetical protein